MVQTRRQSGITFVTPVTKAIKSDSDEGLSDDSESMWDDEDPSLSELSDDEGSDWGAGPKSKKPGLILFFVPLKMTHLSIRREGADCKKPR